MRYPIYKSGENNLLNDSNISEVVNKVKNLIGKDFDVDIKTNDELILFLNRPEDFIEDKDTANSIRNLKELLELMGEYYHV